LIRATRKKKTKKKSASKESVVHGNRRATCHIDNRRSFCIREGKGCRGVAHVGHAISAAGHCLLFVAHVQLERTRASARVMNRIF